MVIGYGTHPLIERDGGTAVRVITQPSERKQIGSAFTPYVTVLKDGGRYRIWYDGSNDSGRFIASAVSDTPTSFLSAQSQMTLVGAYGASVARYRYGFVLAWWGRDPSAPDDDSKGGMWIATSPDGINWTPVGDKPVLPGAGDIVSLTQGKHGWLAYVKMASTPEDGYTGQTQNEPWPGYRRLVAVSSSTDLVHWSAPQRIFAPDSRDEGITEFYGLGGVTYRDGVYVGFLRVLRDDLPADPGGPVNGIGYTVLAWSYDGLHWKRDRLPSLDRTPTAGFDHAMAWADSQIDVGGKTLLFYGGYATGHKSDSLTGRSLGVAEIPFDRYIGWTGGTVTVRAKLRHHLTVNADGAVTVYVGKTVCHASGNGLRLPVRCNRRLPARTVRVTFQSKRGHVYGFSS